MVVEKSKSIFDYKDFRKFLRDHFAFKRKTARGFSFRSFAKTAGFGSHSYLRMVMEGKRNLSLRALKKLASALKLNAEEAAFFVTLALYNQASIEKDKNEYFEKLVVLKPQEKRCQLEKDSLAFFANRNLSILREMTALPHFTENPEKLAQSLGHSVTTEQVRDYIKTLLRLKLVTRDAQGRLWPSQGVVESPVDAESLEVFGFHRSVMNHNKDAMVLCPHDLREVIAVTIPMSLKALPEIKNILRKARDQIVGHINKSSHPFDEVFQVCMQMVPVTKTKEDIHENGK